MSNYQYKRESGTSQRSDTLKLLYNKFQQEQLLENPVVETIQIFPGGIGKSDYSNCHAIPKYSDKSIISDLDKINIPDEIKNLSEQIFQQLDTNTKRGRRRKKLLFYCIFNAYNQIGQPQDPKFIAELVGISHTEMTKAFSMCSELQTNYKPNTTFHSPLEFVEQYHEQIGLDPKCLPDVLVLGTEILKKDPDLNENYPQVVAAGILLYYMTINGASINKKEFSKIVRRSEMTISKVLKRIVHVHNN